MFNRIVEATPISEFCILTRFVSGEKKLYDVRQLLDKRPIFRTLVSTKGLFEQVRVDAGGYGVSWNDDIDLSCDELYNNGTSATLS